MYAIPLVFIHSLLKNPFLELVYMYMYTVCDETHPNTNI